MKKRKRKKKQPNGIAKALQHKSFRHQVVPDKRKKELVKRIEKEITAED